MKEKLTPRRLILKPTGVLFAAYAAYQIFILIRDGGTLSSEGKFISTLIMLLFAVFTAFVWTDEVPAKNTPFLLIRRIVFIVALFAVFVLKLRVADRAVAYLDLLKLRSDLYGGPYLPQSVLYGGAYFMTLTALLLLSVCYTFVLRDRTLYPRAAVILPVSAMILFLCSLICETVLLLAYGIGLEASLLRTAVIRPVFYLGLIGLSVSFLLPPFTPPAKG